MQPKLGACGGRTRKLGAVFHVENRDFYSVHWFVGMYLNKEKKIQSRGSVRTRSFSILLLRTCAATIHQTTTMQVPSREAQRAQRAK